MKTYANAFRNFYSHPELKFLNGDRGDRGPTQRRHVIADSIRLIGKEANQLSEQIAFGLDPDAQLEFGTMSKTDSVRAKRIISAVKAHGVTCVAGQARVSTRHLYRIVEGIARPTRPMLEKLEAAIAALQTEGRRSEASTSDVLKGVREAVGEVGLRAFASTAGVSVGPLSDVLGGKRSCTSALRRKLATALSGTFREPD